MAIFGPLADVVPFRWVMVWFRRCVNYYCYSYTLQSHL